ncbi:MAG TPA: helix-turn-helix domain-containing protein [Candidatus Jeotgalibaca merdavium]|uniref:Helix-turn-helix domain-containing protein n=1 Tax=Candidatus Jeotgalibaca merdavium TaxID=2838627 RepID=A0A9D2I318_9LACT|nr:helix-turn-helix domain-containing protein [Candidatus Jeotgalibaca merdavium]
MRSNDEIIDLLEELRDKRNLSISELARRTGMAKSAVSRYFNRTREFPLNRVNEFARALNVKPEYILGLDFPKPSNMVNMEKIINVPVIGVIAAGTPILAEQNIEEYIPILASMVPSGDLMCLSVNGDSMAPGIPNQSNVIIRLQPNVEEGEIAAILLNGDSEATLKRIKRQNGIMMLISDNQNYQPIIVTKDFPARIIGKAVKVMYDL